MTSPFSKRLRSLFYLWSTPYGGGKIIADRGGEVSVTNDAEAVVQYVLTKYPGKRIIYKDTYGDWAELLHDGKRFTGFAPLGKEDLATFRRL